MREHASHGLAGVILSNTLNTLGEGGDSNALANALLRDGIDLTPFGDTLGIMEAHGEAGAMMIGSLMKNLQHIQSNLDNKAELLGEAPQSIKQRLQGVFNTDLYEQ